MQTWNLECLRSKLSVCRATADSAVPQIVLQAPFYAVTRTDDELSFLVPEECAQSDWRCEHGWRAIKVAGPLDFSLTGVLAALSAPLADAKISIFAISTFDTDYILVKEEMLAQACSALKQQGHNIIGGP